MAARVPRHEHVWAIVAHTIDAKGKARRVLVSCQFTRACGKLEVLRPHQGKKDDTEWWLKWRDMQHQCCPDGTLLPR